MDALPIQERSGVEFSSTVANVMHACGHDAHTAALVGAATMLARRRGDLRGRVRLMFQPAEERLEGARAMIADGVLDGVDVAVSGHVFAGFPLGTVVRRPGPMMAGADLFEIEIAGVGGHAGAPQGSVNPITAAAQLLLALPTLVAYESAPGARVALTITAVESGRAANVVPDRLVMRGSLRWYDDQDRARLLERLGVLGRGICEAFRASFALSVTASVPVMVNAPRLLPAVDAAIAAAGAQALDAGPRGASEDFALVAERLPSFYVGVGAGGPQHPPHHSGTFDLDEDAVPLMAELFTRIALDVLHDDRVH
jgi:amidohydrolase